MNRRQKNEQTRSSDRWTQTMMVCKTWNAANLQAIDCTFFNGTNPSNVMNIYSAIEREAVPT